MKSHKWLSTKMSLTSNTNPHKITQIKIKSIFRTEVVKVEAKIKNKWFKSFSKGYQYKNSLFKTSKTYLNLLKYHKKQQF